MKAFYTLLLLILLIASCSSDKTDNKNRGMEGMRCYQDNTCENELTCIDGICQKETNNCLNITCDKIWSKCNPETGKCDMLKNGYCTVDGHCDTENNEICDRETFKCIETCNDNNRRCSDDAKNILICKNNNWISDTACEDNTICNENSSGIFTCKEKCTTHNECNKKEICNIHGQCIKYDCQNDADCNQVQSVNKNEDLYCDVLAIPRTCIPLENHTCGGESNNDISSQAEKIDISSLPDMDIVLNKQICIKDQDWYFIDLTYKVNSLDIKLSFTEGDLDLIIVDKNFKTIDYSMASNNVNAGGEESVNLKYLPEGKYYIHIYRYKTSSDTNLTVTNTYTLKLYNLNTENRCSKEGRECESLKVLRSVCNESTGACYHMEADNTVTLGDLCEEKSNCNQNATYGCFDMEIEGTNLDNYCTKICSSDSDCTDINMICQSLLVTSVCMKPCTADNDCKLITDEENAVCNNGKCE